MVVARNAAGAARSAVRNTTNFVATGSTGRVNGRAKEEEQDEAAKEARRLCYRLMKVAKRILPEDKGLQACMEMPAVGAGYIQTITHKGTKSGSVRGVCRCANGKRCQMCAARISEVKRGELAEGETRCVAGVVSRWDDATKTAVPIGGALYLVTYTISHKAKDDLRGLMAAFTEAKREMRQQRSYRKLREAFGNPSPVVAWEITWSPWYGWHYHVHELLFVLDVSQQTITPEEFEAQARVEWEEAAARHGLTMNEHGFDFKSTKGAVGDYIAKYGHPPTRRPWGTEDEMAKGYKKQGRVALSRKKNIHLTPPQMLQMIDEGIEFVGDYDLKEIWREYAFATVGKPQIRWAPGLRKKLGLQQEKTDEQIIAEASDDPEKETLGYIPVADWPKVVGNDAVPDLLEKVGTGDFLLVRDWLALLRVRYLRPEEVEPPPKPDES